VAELFGDITDIELEDLGNLDNLGCKWTTLNIWSTGFFVSLRNCLNSTKDELIFILIIYDTLSGAVILCAERSIVVSFC